MPRRWASKAGQLDEAHDGGQRQCSNFESDHAETERFSGVAHDSNGDAKKMAPEAVVSTADCWNRVRDKERVEGELHLPEFGATVNLYDATSADTLIARSYRRIVYGDHGPYVELDTSEVVWENLPVEILKPAHAYYDEYHSKSGFVHLYLQKRSVEHKTNPPPGGVKHDRKGGYADYKVGMCYISPDMLTVSKHDADPADGKASSSRRWKR